MKNLAVLFGVFLSIAVVFSCATAKDPLDGVKGTIESDSSATIKATVVALDLKSRVLTLKDPDGNVMEVVAGDEVKNLPQVAVGDELTVDYKEAVAITLYKKGSVPVANSAAETMTRAEPGQKPSATIKSVITLTAVIQAIDPNAPSVTLKGAGGKIITVAVRDPKNLDSVNVGDEVVITYTFTVDMGITKPAGK